MKKIMEPNFKEITRQLFALEPKEKIADTFYAETQLALLRCTLGKVGQMVYPGLNVPGEVVSFIDELYEYIEKNHIEQ